MPAGALGALLVAVAATGPATAASAGPSIQVDRACYVNARSPARIEITGQGWTPGDSVEVTGAAQPVSATVGSDGTFAATGTAPGRDFALRRQSERLSAAETDATTGQTVPAVSATTAYLVTDLAYSVRPQDTSLTRKVTFRFSGFTADREIFAHYLRGKRVVARQRFGRTTGPCGLLSARALQYPGGHPEARRYEVQFDDARAYSRRSSPRVVTELSVRRY
jgi:hypothetical protein